MGTTILVADDEPESVALLAVHRSSPGARRVPHTAGAVPGARRGSGEQAQAPEEGQREEEQGEHEGRPPARPRVIPAHATPPLA
jgi:hypothetical protein